MTEYDTQWHMLYKYRIRLCGGMSTVSWDQALITAVNWVVIKFQRQLLQIIAMAFTETDNVTKKTPGVS